MTFIIVFYFVWRACWPGLAIRSENILVEDQGSDVIWSMHKEISIPALILWPLSDRTDIAASS